MPMQRRVCYLIKGLDLDIQSVPSSNVVFVRTKREATLKTEKAALLRSCWPVHRAVIERLHVRVILCFGGTAGGWVRQCVGAHELVDRFVERNNRRWTSWAHKNGDDQYVVTLTHPSVTDWTAAATDPTPFVRGILDRL